MIEEKRKRKTGRVLVCTFVIIELVLESRVPVAVGLLTVSLYGAVDVEP